MANKNPSVSYLISHFYFQFVQWFRLYERMLKKPLLVLENKCDKILFIAHSMAHRTFETMANDDIKDKNTNK